jgi:hypothetical protein
VRNEACFVRGAESLTVA